MFVCVFMNAQIGDSVVIYFPKNSSDLDLNFRGNDKSIRRILDTLSIYTNDSVYRIKSITYSGAASPEGNIPFNERLAMLRARSLFSYISNYTVLPDSVQSLKSLGRDWSGLIRLVQQDSNFPQREYLLRELDVIVKNANSSTEDPFVQIQRISSKEAYGYMYNNIFPLLRATYFDIVYEKISKADREFLEKNKKHLDSIVFVEVINPAVAQQPQEPQHTIQQVPQSEVQPAGEVAPTQQPAQQPIAQQQATQEQPVQEQPVQEQPAQQQAPQEQQAQQQVLQSEVRSAGEVASTQQPLVQEQPALPTDTITEPQDSAFCRPFYMAIKSNMLYDLAMTPNAGIEFYLGAGFSLSANWQYAWWKRDKSAFYWRIYGGDAEVRYWFGKLAKEKPLTGHHVGIYGQMVTYDFIFGRKGVLAPRWSWVVGASYGYSLPIHEVLNLDFVVGLGYHSGIFKEYELIDDHYAWQATKRRHWVGPTKAEITLVWLIGCDNYNRKTVFDKKQKAIEETVEALVGNDKGGAL